MNVEQIMSHEPVCIDAKARAHEALVLASRQGVHYLLVVGEDNDLDGITCLCDVERARVNESVRSFAHSPVTYVMAGESAARAALIMQQCAVGCLPVLREPGHVIGVLTRHDLRAVGAMDPANPCACCGANHDLVENDRGLALCRRCLRSL
ncbi:MAG TPA: CBS domain-containing protein [Polyangiaceae bacterium]